MDEVGLHSDKKSQVFFGIRLGKNLSVFLICLSLTTVFWLLNAFTKDYTTELYFPLSYKNLPKEQVVVNDLPKFLAVEVNGCGFKLLSFYLFGSLDSLTLDYAQGIRKIRETGDLRIIPKHQLKNLASAEIPADIKIENINIDSLRILTDPIVERILPISPMVKYTIADQYYLKDSISVSPDQIVAAGPASLINKMKGLKTKEINLDLIDKSVSIDVDVDFPEKFNAITKHVRLKIPIDKATEKELSVPLEVVSDSNGIAIKTFPNQVTLKIKVGLSDFSRVSEDQFKVIARTTNVDASDKYLKVNVVKAPDFAEVTSVSPRRVEYIIKK